MPTYRTTNAAGRNAHAAVNARPRRSKAPYIAAVGIVVAVIAAAAAVMAFAFEHSEAGSRAEQVSGQAEPMASTTFSEALPAETVVAADDVVMTIAGDRDTDVLKGEEYIEAGCHAVDPDTGDITSSGGNHRHRELQRAGRLRGEPTPPPPPTARRRRPSAMSMWSTRSMRPRRTFLR